MQSDDRQLTHAERAAAVPTAPAGAESGGLSAQGEIRPADRRLRVSGREDGFALLTWAAGFDQKSRGWAEAEAWAAALHGIPVDDARAAITVHYQRSPWPVMPAHIIRIIEDGDIHHGN